MRDVPLSTVALLATAKLCRPTLALPAQQQISQMGFNGDPVATAGTTLDQNAYAAGTPAMALAGHYLHHSCVHKV